MENKVNCPECGMALSKDELPKAVEHCIEHYEKEIIAKDAEILRLEKLVEECKEYINGISCGEVHNAGFEEPCRKSVLLAKLKSLGLS